MLTELRELITAIGSQGIMDFAQTIAIVVALCFSFWQWKRTRETMTVDNYSKIISAMNALRDTRIQVPALERSLFKARQKWSDKKIRKHVYGVGLANIFEWAFLSYNRGLIGEKEWQDWASMWRKVILADESMRRLMADETIYTFSLDAHKLIKSWIKELETG